MTSEPPTVVRKRSWRDEHLERICGFANARGGVLEIGRDDRGEIVGVKGVLGLLEEIPKKARSMLGIVVGVNLKSESGREYIEVGVEPHRNPISYRGRFHYRSGRAKRVLDGAELNRLMLARFGRGWDDAPGRGVGLKDLDGRSADRFRRRAVRCERLPAEVLDESVEGLVENLELRDGAHLKRAAALLFHPSPHRLVRGAYVTIGCLQGSRLLFGDVVEGDLFTQVDRTMDLLYTKYSRGLISYDGIYRVETFPVPRAAMWEALINAVVHRDYASDAPIRIRVRDDRISIWNPARLTPEWSPDGPAGEHSSRLHNPRLAYAFFQAGMIETWGRGVRQMVDTCREVGNPTPTWTLDAGGEGLRVKFPFSEAYRAADADARGISAPKTTAMTTQKTTPKTTPKTTATTRKIPLPAKTTAKTTASTTTSTTAKTTAIATSARNRQKTARRGRRQPEPRRPNRRLPAAKPLGQPSEDRRGACGCHRGQRQISAGQAQECEQVAPGGAGQGRTLDGRRR